MYAKGVFLAYFKKSSKHFLSGTDKSLRKKRKIGHKVLDRNAKNQA